MDERKPTLTRDTVYPLHSLRTLALHTQGLTRANGTESAPTGEAIRALVEQIGCVQIDTLQMVQRSHYLALWSRLGSYETADFDRLIYSGKDSVLMEQWRHAASIIPLTTYRHQLPRMRSRRETPATYTARWLAEESNQKMLVEVKERIRREGPLRSADFKYDGPKRGSWWDWKPAKYALEVLFSYGDLMISDRVNFQRFYELTERALPDWVNADEPTQEEADRFFVEQGARALGVCRPGQTGDYAHRKRGVTNRIAGEMIVEGVLVEIQGELANGEIETLVVHRDNLGLLEQAAAREIVPERTTFLSPFDNLFWAQRRDLDLWGFWQSLEAYKPAEQRKYGYFCLPILHKGRLAGRFDPKLERKTGTLRLKAMYLEKGVTAGDELVRDVAEAMRDFLAFHEADDLVIEASKPKVFGKKLLKAL